MISVKIMVMTMAGCGRMEKCGTCPLVARIVIDLSKMMVGEEGLEPSRCWAREPKSRVSTNFTTRPTKRKKVEHSLGDLKLKGVIFPNLL